jgi:hypothetical protein
MNQGSPTPPEYRDNYTDETRPHGAVAIVGPNRVIFYWSSSSRTWWMQTPVEFNVIPPSPYGSPVTTFTIPQGTPQTTSFTIQQGTHQTTAAAVFPPRQQLSAPPPTQSARFILEVSPEMGILQYSGIVYASSEANVHYGGVGPLSPWALPSDLCGYQNLRGLYHYVPPNPLAAGITEGDTVLTAMNAFFQPVDMVLHQNCGGHPLASFSESSSTVSIGNGRAQTSRVDRSWAFQKGQTWIKFAVVEFKRRGALVQTEWNATAPGSQVEGRGGKICRQLKKYASHCQTRFVACCDGEKLVTMILEGDSTKWYNDRAFTAPITPARSRWVGDSGEMKRYLFLFLKEALEAKLSEHRM